MHEAAWPLVACRGGNGQEATLKPRASCTRTLTCSAYGTGVAAASRSPEACGEPQRRRKSSFAAGAPLPGYSRNRLFLPLDPSRWARRR